MIIEEITTFAREEPVTVIFLVIALLMFLGVSYWQWYKPRKAKPMASLTVIRGEISFSYLLFAFGALVAISTGLIAVTEISNLKKIVLIILCSIFLFYLCFFNDYFRNKIIGILSKAKAHKEKF